MHERPGSPSTTIPWLLLVGVFVVYAVSIFIIFGASVGYGFLSFDDSYLIYNNLAAHGPTPSHIWKAFTTFDPELYIPLTLLSYQLNYLFAGLSGGFYHFTNLVLHAGNAALVFALAVQMTKHRGIALLAGAIFAVHPLHTEAVVWLAARKDLLSTFLYLATLVTFVHHRKYGGRSAYALGIALFLLALLSKVSVLTLPVALLLLSYTEKGSGETWKDRLKTVSPLLLLSLLFAGIAAFAKARVIGSATLFETILMACKSTVFYLQKLLLPIDLTPLYPYTKAISLTSPDFYIPVLILVVIGAALIMSLKWSRWPMICFAAFVVTLAPSFLNFHKGSAVFFAVDRYAYLPSVWLLMGLGIGLATLAKKRSGGATTKRIVAVLVGLGISVLGRMSMTQTTYWRDDETLFTHALTLYPESVSARMSLAAEYRIQGRFDEEKKVLVEAEPFGKHVSILTALGSVAVRDGRLTDADKLYADANALDPRNPEPYFFIGSLEEGRGNAMVALENYQKAFELDPSYVAAYNNAGAIHLDRNEFLEAEAMFRKSVEWNPNFMEGNYNLFQTLEFQKKNDEAFPYLEAAAELNPDSSDILITYAYRLNDRGDKDEALRVLDHLLSIDPDNASAKRLRDFVGGDEENDAVKSSEPSAEERRRERLQQRQTP